MKNNDTSQQTAMAVEKNQDFFANNDAYKSIQNKLEHYRLLALSAKEAIRGARKILDIGNGGLFIYPIDNLDEIVAVDIFIEDDFSKKYPTVKWIQASALYLPFENAFDTAIEINTLHHIIGKTVADNYKNLDQFFNQAHKALISNGRLVLIESTVPMWFLIPYKWIFPIFTRLWPLRHPPTYQFHFRDIERAAAANGFTMDEFTWIPKCGPILAFGKAIPGWVSPVKVAKFIFTKR